MNFIGTKNQGLNNCYEEIVIEDNLYPVDVVREQILAVTRIKLIMLQIVTPYEIT